MVRHALRAAIGAALCGTPSLAFAQQGPGYYGPGMMWGGGGIFHMLFGTLMMLLFVGAIVLLVVVAFRWVGGSGGPFSQASGQAERRALDILKERLARGEIDVAEYEERKRALGE
jgi:putative membrane protein